LSRASRKNRFAAAGPGLGMSSTLREEFLTLLEEQKGDWRDEAVMAKLAELEQSNPTPAAAFTGDHLDAEWLQVSSPDYNYGNKGSTEYTLGQLSFNMYEPSDMKMRIDRTTQIVAPVNTSTDIRTWDISMKLTCVDDRYPPFKVEMKTFGQIKPSKDKDGQDRRLEVWFTGGHLQPGPESDAATKEKWQEMVGTAQKSKGFDIGGMLRNAFLKLAMGLRPPEGADESGRITFEMNRPPHGYTDILYMDDRLRVTKGNRGSIVVATRDN